MPTVTAARTTAVVAFARPTPALPPPPRSPARPDAFEAAAATRRPAAVRLAEAERALQQVRTQAAFRLGELRAHMFTATPAELLAVTAAFPAMARERRALLQATQHVDALASQRADVLHALEAKPHDARLLRQLDAVDAKLERADTAQRRAVRAARLPLATLDPDGLAKAERALTPRPPRGDSLAELLARADRLTAEVARLHRQVYG